MNAASGLKPMDCPSCQKKLPLRFAFSAENKSKSCLYCHSFIVASVESLKKIKTVSGLLSFVPGLPLGLLCCYLWLEIGQWGVALIMFITGIIGMVGSATIYSCSHITFSPEKIQL